MIAQSPMAIRTSQCLRKSCSTWTFSSLQQPPSMRPDRAAPRELLDVVDGRLVEVDQLDELQDALVDVEHATCGSRSTRPETSWRPSVCAMDDAPTRLPGVLDLGADGCRVVVPLADGDGVADALLDEGSRPGRRRRPGRSTSTLVSARRAVGVDGDAACAARVRRSRRRPCRPGPARRARSGRTGCSGCGRCSTSGWMASTARLGNMNGYLRRGDPNR